MSKWNNTANITGRIYNVVNDLVFVDCLVNEQNSEFEQRTFPKHLFDSIPDFKVGKFIVIRLYQKPNELRIRITEGENGIKPNTEPFEVDLFQDLRDSEIFKLSVI